MITHRAAVALLRKIHDTSIMCQNEHGFVVMVIDDASDINNALYDAFGQPRNTKETKKS